MKVYIAGRITGDPEYADKFFTTSERLRERGMIVLNPAMLPAGMEKADYMRICLSMLDTADIVCFLNGWEESPGAQLEMAWCRYVEKAVCFEPDGKR